MPDKDRVLPLGHLKHRPLQAACSCSAALLARSQCAGRCYAASEDIARFMKLDSLSLFRNKSLVSCRDILGKSSESKDLFPAYLFDVVLVSNDMYRRQRDLLLVNIREVPVSDEGPRKENGKLERGCTLQELNSINSGIRASSHVLFHCVTRHDEVHRHCLLTNKPCQTDLCSHGNHWITLEAGLSRY